MTPHEQQQTGPHQRAYSVMAVPSELEYHHYNRYNNKKQQQQEEPPLIWYQEIYKKYGYEPNKHKNPMPSYFGPYLLLQTLGEGEFAKVKAGVHVQTNQEVAIKLMRKDHIKHASLDTKLEREISVLKSVRHPYIVKLFEVLTIKNYIGIVLQRAAGGELFDYILKHHYLQEIEAKRLFAQLISGVHYMHQKHIVHRDLKLENLLLSKDRDIIITDFGFANRFLIAQQDLMATSCGSPCYAAPELVINDDENNHYVGTAVDIWSCGVILFAMLCGYLPFDDDPSNPQGANINVLYKYIVSTKLEIPKHMSKEATHLLRIMLVPDPAKRCNMEDIRHHPWLKEHQDLLLKDYISGEQEAQDHMNNVSDTRLMNSVNQVLQTHDNTIMSPSPHSPSPSSNNNNTQTAAQTQTENQVVPESRKEEEKSTNNKIVICATTTHDDNDDVCSLTIKEEPAEDEDEDEDEEEEEIVVMPSTPPTPTVTAPIVKPTISTTSQSTRATTSFLQAKFFSTLQQRAANTQPKERPSSVSPIINSNKIPTTNRSRSVVQQRRERTTSELLYTNNNNTTKNNRHQSLNILPSVSEQSTVVIDQITPSASQAIRTKGQKLMDWFKRKPSSSQSTKFTTTSSTNNRASTNNIIPTTTKTTTTPRPERPVSALPIHPMRAMSIGKPLGSYAADFNDAKLRLHRGAVDQDALTSKAPNEVLLSIKESLQLMGIDMKRVSDFKMKCVRPAKVQPPTSRTRKLSTVPFKLFFSTSTTTAGATTATANNKRASIQKQQEAPQTPTYPPAPAPAKQVIYGEQGIDSGEEVQFSVELSKIENLPGLYVVDIKRTRGNIWAFKFLYHTLLDLLDLSGGAGMGYMAQRNPHSRSNNSDEEEVNSSKNRISYMTTSSSGSSMMIFDESILHK